MDAENKSSLTNPILSSHKPTLRYYSFSQLSGAQISPAGSVSSLSAMMPQTSSKKETTSFFKKWCCVQ